MQAAERTPVAVLISGRGSNMMALIEAARAADYPARFVLALADRADAGGLALAEAAGVPARAIPRKDFQSRAAFEAALDAAIDESGARYVCLAGFMRILSGDFVARRAGRIVNIHPSLLPSFRGLDTHERALEAGVKLHGATVHIVTETLDDGPILAQAALPVLADDTAETLAARVLTLEHRLYPAALRRLLSPGTEADAPAPASLFNPPELREG